MRQENVNLLNNKDNKMAMNPTKAPKAVEYADIKGQGRIPYGKTASVKIPTGMSKGTARGMGAAVKGGSYIACK
tara:strand:- start:266 stop:487 length:222 start_codon:yes stop_codon:yes gene_type:complete